MGDIVIIGAGFAGLEAARVFSKKRKLLGDRRVIVVDRKRTSDFFPLLPDVAAGRIDRSCVELDLGTHLENLGIGFENAEVASIDTRAREVRLKEGRSLAYEYLVLCPGAVTNFYGQKDMERKALKLDSVENAAMIHNTISAYPQKNFVVVGGGYTGLEIATNIAVFFRRRKVKKYGIHVVEMQEDILGPLAAWMKDYCRINLCRLRIQLHTGVSIREAGEKRLVLSNGLEINDYILIWAAGVQAPDLVRELPFGKDKQGRLNMENRSLLLTEGIFCAGDSACYARGGQRPLRMAVQFSIAEARIAAKNIVNLCIGRRPRDYKPVDLGFLVPMANRTACGKILFVPLKGLIAWVLHYIMCIYRSYGLNRKLCVFKEMIFG